MAGWPPAAPSLLLSLSAQPSAAVLGLGLMDLSLWPESACALIVQDRIAGPPADAGGRAVVHANQNPRLRVGEADATDIHPMVEFCMWTEGGGREAGPTGGQLKE